MGDDPSASIPPPGRKANSKDAANREKPANSWLIPAITAAVLASAFCLYYFVYVAAQREYLANRNFRSLAVLGAQVQSMVSIHGSILEFYADLAESGKSTHRDKQDLSQYLVIRPEDKSLPAAERDKEARKDYLRYLAPSFELTEIPSDSRGNAPRPRLEVQRRNGKWELALTAHKHSGAAATYTGSLELESAMKPLVGNLPFDDILLVSEKGAIVYQSNRAGPQFTTLTGLLQAQAQGAETGAGTENHDNKDSGAHPAEINQNTDQAWRARPKHLTDVVLAGTRSRLFLQPVLVDVFSDETGEDEPAREWVLCGLRSSKALEWEALSISSTLVIWFTAIFLAVCMSGPILKVLFMNRRERLRLRELGFLAVFLILLTAVFTLSGLQAVGFPLNDDTEPELNRLGGRLSAGIHDELRQMRDQLKTWCASDDLRRDLKAAEHREVIRSSETAATTPPATIYPYLTNVFWTDDDGHQIVKWSSGAYVTPMIDVAPLRIYSHPKSMYLDGRVPPFYFDSLVPPNKLEYLATFSIDTEDCNPGLLKPDSSGQTLRGDVTGGSAFLTAEPLSLIDPILPFGYGFALLDETGAVLFHSDKTRNLHENFLQESDWSKQLYAAAFGHSSQRSLKVKYLGKDYQAHVTPVSGVSQAPWSLIVYRDLTSIRTLNLQGMTMASTLLLVILFPPVFAVAIWCALRHPRFTPEWAWPNPERIRTYFAQMICYALLALSFLFLGFAGSVEQNTIACAVFPYAALLLTVWCFRKYPSALSAPPPPEGSLLWRKYYLAGLILFVFLTGVLVPMALFRACLKVESRLEVKQAQLHLASALGRRLESAKDRCANGELSETACREFRKFKKDPAGPPGQHLVWDKIVFDPLLSGPGSTAGDLPVTQHSSALRGGELYGGWFQSLIYALHHDYNQSAAEMLGVIPDRFNPPGSDFPDWAWENTESAMTLRWHGVHLPEPGSRDVEDDLLITSPVPAASWRDAFSGGCVAFAVIAIIGLLIRELVRRVFLFHIVPLKITGERRVLESLRAGRSVAVLVPPVSTWEPEEPGWILDVSTLAGADNTWAEALDPDTLPLNTLIEIRHFEYTSGNAVVDNQKFLLLEKLLRRENTQIAVVMTVPVSSEDYHRMFPDLETIDLREEPFYWLKQYEGPARDLIWKECGPLPALWPLGAQLAKDIGADDAHSEETIASEILERAEPYYRLVWKECSRDQKFALAQLADDGLLNYTNSRAIRQMVRRGLIVTDPQFRIVNESFRRFLKSHAVGELKREWLDESRRSGWGKIHGAFFTTLILLGVFLLTTQNELWQSSAAYVTTALGALGTLTKLLNGYRGGGSVVDKEKPG